MSCIHINRLHIHTRECSLYIKPECRPLFYELSLNNFLSIIPQSMMQTDPQIVNKEANRWSCRKSFPTREPAYFYIHIFFIFFDGKKWKSKRISLNCWGREGHKKTLQNYFWYKFQEKNISVEYLSQSKYLIVVKTNSNWNMVQSSI